MHIFKIRYIFSNCAAKMFLPFIRPVARSVYMFMFSITGMYMPVLNSCFTVHFLIACEDFFFPYVNWPLCFLLQQRTSMLFSYLFISSILHIEILVYYFSSMIHIFPRTASFNIFLMVFCLLSSSTFPIFHLQSVPLISLPVR